MQSQKNILSSKNNHGRDNVISQLVTVSIESSLLGHDVIAYGKVTELLSTKYTSDMSDCYYHPEYLNDALSILPGNLRQHVTKSIRKGLDEFAYIDEVSIFLSQLSK
jgi:hypothetical protein